ncbi:tetratricopeptide (TPR) repeat protein [Saccharothrix violaceirubra]|uniref:Tetratricopeptide (TPR) repeat protein n=1 Tax=Saccharothrix violaceirubra TaxID=413306 RepID=A0A7W7SZA7_9PSEU|nr:CHAT domain-containing protein [Saccharothrix violaceirubra]MBB4963711.1 tetratricopeptide (TPR) repeat protein [Saccharothrix violaceirubra]
MPAATPSDGGSTGAAEKARLLHRRGKKAATADRHPTAILLLKRALAVLDAAQDVDSVVRVEIRTRVQATLAYCLAETTSLDEGAALLDRVRAELAELPDMPLKDELHGLIDHNHAVLLCRVGRIKDGIVLFDSDVRHTERRLAETTGDRTAVVDWLVTSLSNRGNAHGTSGSPSLAVRDLNRAIDLAREYGLHERVGIATHALGNFLQRIGDMPAALRRYEEANRLFTEHEPGLLLRLRLDQAEAMLSVGLADEAGRHLDEVLPEMRRQRILQDHAEAELFRGAAALLEGEVRTARRMAVSAHRRLLRRGSPGWAAIAALMIARVDVQKALDARVPAALPRRVLELSDQLAVLRLADASAQARMLAVRLEVKLGNVDRAAELFAAVPTPRPTSAIDHRMLVRMCRAELALARGDRRAALAQAKAGLTELGRMRDSLGAVELVSGSALHGRELGDFAVRLVLGCGDSPADARRLFTWLERTRAQLYRYDPVESTVDSELRERIAEVRRLSRALLRARLDGAPTSKLEIQYAAAQRDAMRLGWSESPWGKPRPVARPRDVMDRLGDRALISFAASDDSLVAVVVLASGVRMVRLGSAAEVNERARRLHADLNALAPDHLPPPLVEVITASARREAERLDETLLRPLVDLIGDRDLVVVPTGALYVVPWAVLPTCASRPTVVVPSATAWLSTTRADPEEASGVLLVRGPGLVAAEDEIDRLAGYHSDARTLGLPDARVSAVLKALDGVELAHIAAHGEHEPDNALFSRLELIDGALFAHEVGRVRRPPHRVVLSACELALNRIRPGDEPLGFAGALLAGGALTVIAASSKVGDQPSAAAMADFHRNLANGAAPAVALAEAVAVDPFRRPFVCLGSG